MRKWLSRPARTGSPAASRAAARAPGTKARCRSTGRPGRRLRSRPRRQPRSAATGSLAARPGDVPQTRAMPRQMRHVLEEDANVGHRPTANQLLVHVRLEGELLHVLVLADAHEPLPPAIGRIPEPLHDAEHPEDLAVGFHEAPARQGQSTHLTGLKERMHGLGGESPACHGIEDPFAGSRCDDSGGIAGQNHVATVVPARQRLHRDRRPLAPQRVGVTEFGRDADLRRPRRAARSRCRRCRCRSKGCRREGRPSRRSRARARRDRTRRNASRRSRQA